MFKHFTQNIIYTFLNLFHEELSPLIFLLPSYHQGDKYATKLMLFHTEHS